MIQADDQATIKANISHGISAGNALASREELYIAVGSGPHKRSGNWNNWWDKAEKETLNTKALKGNEIDELWAV